MNKFFIPFIAVALTSTLAQAQSFNVKKMKGKQAIIQMTSGTFTEGQSVTVGGGEASSSSSSMGSGGGSGSRNNYLGLEFGFTSAKVGTVTQTALALAVKYGWNKGTIEYGVLGGFGSTSGGTSTSSFAVGGNFDYNFTENRPGVDGIFFVGIDGRYGTSSPGSATTITIFPSVGYKWFALGNATAIRFDAGMQMVQTSISGASTTDTQPAVSGGLAVYF